MAVRQPYVVRTRADLKAAVAQVAEYPEFVIDIETDGLSPRTNSISWVGLGTYGQVFLVPIQHPLGRLLREERLTRTGKPSRAKNPPIVNRYYAKVGEQLMPDVVVAEIEPLLFGRKTKIGHNVKFDLLSLAKYYDNAIPPGPYQDTLVMQHVMDENRRSYSLKDIAPDFLRVPPAFRKTFYPNLGKNVAAHPIDAVARYLAKDLRFCWLLWQALTERIEGENLQGILALEMDLYPVIMEMERSGATVDTEHLGFMGQELQIALEDIKQRVWSEAYKASRNNPTNFELTNTDVKRNLLFKAKRDGGQGLKPLKLTPKQQLPVLDQATLEYYADRNEMARLMLEHSEKQKILSTYVTGIQNRMHDGLVHTSFTQHGTVTGRLSSRDPNLQNIPRESNVRGLFVAPPGYALIVADYDQIELRVTAHFARDERMVGIFERGEDIHAGTMAAILGKPIEEVSKDERQIGKGINFAVVYGAGPRKVAAMARVDYETACLFMDRYYNRFAAIRPWKARVLAVARRRGNPLHPKLQPPYVTTLLGRRRRLPELFSRDSMECGRAERQAVNHIVQGTAAEIMKIAMIKVHRAFADEPFTLILTVHDELVSLCPAGMETKAKAAVVSAMSGITLGDKPIIDIPLVVSCGTATRWSEAKG